MLKNVLSLDESSPPFSTVAGGTEVVVSVDRAEGAGDARASLEVRSEAEVDDAMVGGASPSGGFEDMATSQAAEGEGGR